MPSNESSPEHQLTEQDQAEVNRLAERSGALDPDAMDRRGFIAASGKALAFGLPAIATFTISPDALGATGSGGINGVGNSGSNGMTRGARHRWTM